MPATFVLPRQVGIISGDVAPGSVLRFYRTATTTPQAVYTDAALSNAVTSITADSSGVFSKVYLNPNATHDYRVQLEAASGAVQYIEDDISRFPASQEDIGAALYPKTEAEEAEGISPADYRFEPGNIRRYGALGASPAFDTSAFEDALLSGHPVLLPKLEDPYHFSGPILVPSDTVIWCEPGVQVIMPDGGLATNIGWIRMRDVDNVTIHGNGSIWEFQTKPDEEEQRHAFDIRGSSNIRIRDTIARKSGGDGYYVGAGATNEYSENVCLENIQADDCRRQGLSIVSAINCWVNGALFENIDGTSPGSGVDIEPNGATDELKGIRLTNVVTRACTGPGIKAVINDLPADYPVDIVITGHRDEGSQNAFNPQYGTQMTGSITYRDGHSVEAQGSGVFIRGWRSVSCPILIENFTCDDPNDANDITNAYNGHAVSIFSAGSDAADDIGNIDIVGLRARDRRDTPQMKSAVYARNTVSAGTSSKVRVIRPYEIEGTTEQAVELKFTSDIVLDDPHELTRRDYTADATYSTTSQHALITNAGAVGAITISLDSNCPVGDRIRCRVEAAQEFRIDPDGSSSILPGGTAGVYRSSNVVGSEIDIERISTTAWYIKNSVGIWPLSSGTPDPTYAASNVTPDRTYDANATTTDELADVLGTLIADLRAQGIVK